ncbi:polysaccharide pyruvyl transferase family protein [Oceanobacillus sp. FSL K6-3682]|uniref:polysaccharide pyruvyl transferase family protein n=1 Tax=Oceanobacillus sp. FSL K6-3682 TaxID=2921503 RepID=UPI0030D93845
MKKILVRSGMSPLDTFSADEIIKRNAIGNNVGNLMYAYSVFRNLTTENVELVSDYYRTNPADADMINETYNAYAIPLANAIRPGFIPTLKKYTELIEKLKIPVYVIGMGMAFPYEPNIDSKRPFDDDVRRFVSAVLEKSSILGLRGQITSDYLSYLGFKEGRDHQVIGCPSMYTYGENIKIRDIELNDNSSLCVNMTPKAEQQALRFLNGLSDQYKNLDFIPQDMDEMILTYSGIPLLGGAVNTKVDNYPNSLTSDVYMNNQVKFFLSAPSWIEHMRNVDLSIGTRLHGNVAPTLAGTPSITIPIDARMRELSEYHNFPRVSIGEINDDTKLEDLLDKVDLHSVEKSHQKNYDNFIGFLEKNDIEHVYNYNSQGLQLPLETKLEKINLKNPVIPITSCGSYEMKERLQKSFEIMVSKQEKEKNKQTSKVKEKNKTISDLKKTVNKKESIIKKDEKVISELRLEIEKKADELKNKKKQNKKLMLKLQNIENSRSWKLTRPLRLMRQKNNNK